jgi:hypothetical protein
MLLVQYRPKGKVELESIRTKIDGPGRKRHNAFGVIYIPSRKRYPERCPADARRTAETPAVDAL